jgi:hypothetical protein
MTKEIILNGLKYTCELASESVKTPTNPILMALEITLIVIICVVVIFGLIVGFNKLKGEEK